MNNKLLLRTSAFITFFLYCVNSVAQTTSSAAETTNNELVGLLWIAICCAMVLIMQAGFLLLEGGMVRSKNAINVILKNFTDIGLGTLGYWLFGFGLMFGANASGWLGTSNFFPNFTNTGDTLNLLYQMMFAATAATIVSGAVAERFSFLPYISGAFIVTALVYPVFGSWVWGGSGENLGWLNALGFHDMAGATVVHAIGGWCALGALILIGPRTGRFSRKGDAHDIPGHNLPLVALGGLILWFGWFGFNGGSADSNLENLGLILLNTHIGAISGICGAIATLVITKRGFLITVIVNGALGGLVSVTGGADVISPFYAGITGFIAGVIIVLSTSVLNQFRIDDVVGAVSVHAFCGSWGTLAVGLFYTGDLFNVERIATQVIGIVAALVWGVGASMILFWSLNRVSILRVNTQIERRGLDISEHKEIAYSDFMVSHVKADK